MYKLLLCLRYLRTRYLAFVCIVSVMLGVATLIVVNAVMSGFSTKLKDRLRGVISDVMIETDGMMGFVRQDKDGRPILDPRDGKTRRFKVASDEFFGMLATLDEAGHGDRMRRDLNELANRYPQSGWSQAVTRVNGPAEGEGPEVEVAVVESDEDAA